MSEAEFSIHTPTDDVLTLDQAVLLYHGRSGGALATVHEILTVDGAPVIGAGRAMTAQAARELASALLQRAAHGGFLPETVLYVHGDVLVWWAPPARRRETAWGAARKEGERLSCGCIVSERTLLRLKNGTAGRSCPLTLPRHGATVHAFDSGTRWIVHSDVYDFNGSEYLMGQSAYHPRHELPIRIAAS